ncbi:hypothetical protein Ppa06_57010 [Planomonospora parontospora subsp. parontospora]|uniref:Uncharacterized protein n=2 Tax=Planomonospora parontospora TaxID=58119 RepID=A0AA37BP51_9ACTN|nr:hypothetical protein GCM10010126_67200 [Planomonospora parontospora]GII11903.1 hypothetical protein Ppa06_57010 [Planomonospora parontospora subsp. parontospora]
MVRAVQEVRTARMVRAVQEVRTARMVRAVQEVRAEAPAPDRVGGFRDLGARRRSRERSADRGTGRLSADVSPERPAGTFLLVAQAPTQSFGVVRVDGHRAARLTLGGAQRVVAGGPPPARVAPPDRPVGKLPGYLRQMPVERHPCTFPAPRTAVTFHLRRCDTSLEKSMIAGVRSTYRLTGGLDLCVEVVLKYI